MSEKSVVTFDIDNVIFYPSGFGKRLVAIHGAFVNFAEGVMSVIPHRIVSAVSDREYSKSVMASALLPQYIDQVVKIYNVDVRFISGRQPFQVQSTIRQFSDNGISIKEDNLIMVKTRNKIRAIKEVNSKLHVDDADMVIKQCNAEGVASCMISNERTKYNYYMRGKTLWTESILPVIANMRLLLGCNVR